MNIGQFKSAANGQLVGSIATATIDLARLGLRPVDSTNDKAPAFEICTFNGKRWVVIGALWEQTSNTSGEVFYQGRVDDPSMREPLPISLFGNMEEGYRVVWNRPQARRQLMDGTPARKARNVAPTEDFSGNATADGQLAEAGEGELPPM